MKSDGHAINAQVKMHVRKGMIYMKTIASKHMHNIPIIRCIFSIRDMVYKPFF